MFQQQHDTGGSHWCVCVCVCVFTNGQNTICKQRRCQTISDWFFNMSNWPSGGFVWFSLHQQNLQKAKKIRLSNAHEIRKYFGNEQMTNSWAVLRFYFVRTAPFLNITTLQKSGPRTPHSFRSFAH